MRKVIFLLIILVFYAGLSFSAIIENIFSKGISDDTVFVVDKSQKKLFVVQVKNDMPEIIWQYNNILLGEMEGDKQVEGDKKTPEGIYRVVSFIPKNQLSEIYGEGAYPLNYPNPVDKIFGKTGYGIWIHGLKEDSGKKYTQGCVALHNGDLVSLSKYNPIGKNVVISKHINLLSETDYIAKKSELLSYLDDYIVSWENNNFEKFASFYHLKFRNNSGKNLKSYLSLKKRLMDLYPYRKIFYDKLKILKEDDRYLYYRFRQLYCSTNLISEGVKELYLFNESGSYQIIYENYKDQSDYNMFKNYVIDFIEKWKTAWISKNIDEYINFYSDNFYSKGMNKEGWKEYKSKLFNKIGKIDIKIEKVEVSFTNSNNITVRFIQKYKADDYSDVGIKTLRIVGCPGDFKIKEELWRKLK
ncbi:conserved hypothetical protein [Deferribacter desulfuricans SSM1]|uniref:L,D-TPase catalytic domain-containing protein n=1 Tax=Deferribacter desulfuricans (strain DSM 14783 / JCM 11476 / NBRC 101012 / SSM1) TaxID=639282 RepID=D3PCX3_DEFDS|nr:L,D-transpeptidase family protein [Deferribacter desulfuricans]BAI80446.1 conserved hypothetical protein [Deferribacter desulfuricans SSM1]